jgi:rhodanese-related sulfurtransferase
MRNILFAALVAVAAVGCTKADKSNNAPAAAPATAPAANVVTATVDDVDHALAAGQCTPVDANGEGTRKQMGVIPGAVLLTSDDSYALSELPSDKSKPLVFYCANTQCGASHHAAARAMTAGYTNVKVMPEGIAGWVSAGKKTRAI